MLGQASPSQSQKETYLRQNLAQNPLLQLEFDHFVRPNPFPVQVDRCLDEDTDHDFRTNVNARVGGVYVAGEADVLLFVSEVAEVGVDGVAELVAHCGV